MTDTTTRTYQVQYHTSGSNIDTAYVDADSYDRLEVPSSFGVDRYLAFTLDGRIVAEIRQTSVIAVVDITDMGVEAEDDETSFDTTPELTVVTPGPTGIATWTTELPASGGPSVTQPVFPNTVTTYTFGEPVDEVRAAIKRDIQTAPNNLGMA